MTHATNKVKFRDDAPLLPNYLKQAGHAIDQRKDYIDAGTMTGWIHPRLDMDYTE